MRQLCNSLVPVPLSTPSSKGTADSPPSHGGRGQTVSRAECKYIAWVARNAVLFNKERLSELDGFGRLEFTVKPLQMPQVELSGSPVKIDAQKPNPTLALPQSSSQKFVSNFLLKGQKMHNFQMPQRQKECKSASTIQLKPNL